jgi:hypothetical protein
MINFKHYEKKILTVMVNNSTNINKTNNHLLSQLIEHKKNLKNGTYDVGIPVPGHDLGKAQKCVGVKLVNKFITKS